jgi:UrcA family protein
MKQTLKIIAASALATAAIIKAAPALAEPLPAENVSIVRTADLDLSSAKGRAALDHRLVNAAAEVCGWTSDADLSGKNELRKCRHEVLAAARSDSEALLAGLEEGRAIRVAAR